MKSEIPVIFTALILAGMLVGCDGQRGARSNVEEQSGRAMQPGPLSPRAYRKRMKDMRMLMNRPMRRWLHIKQRIIEKKAFRNSDSLWVERTTRNL